MEEVQAPDGGYSRNQMGTWTIRRRIIISTLLFCAFSILYIMFFGAPESQINEAIVLGAFGLAGMVIGSYCFGAVWDDKTQRSHLIGSNNNFYYREPSYRQRQRPVVAPSEERRRRAEQRLERMRRAKVDNPDG